jgi:2-dehydropantoate 2-reductase
MCSVGAGRTLIRRAMIEVQCVGEGLGLGPFEDIDARIASRAAFGPVKTSMLQDWENNEDLEIDAILAAVIELGERIGIATPTLCTILELSMLKVEARRTRKSDL